MFFIYIEFYVCENVILAASLGSNRTEDSANVISFRGSSFSNKNKDDDQI